MVNTQVIILAGGLGTRLYPISIARPKALLSVCNVTLLARLLGQLHAAGFNRAALTLPAFSQHIVEKAQPASEVTEKYDGSIDLEQRIIKLLSASTPQEFKLQTSCISKGQVPTVKRLLAPDASSVLVIYGDSLLSMDFGALIRAHAAARDEGAMATIVHHRPDDLRIAEIKDRTYHGVMSVNDQGRVTRFVEKPLVEQICDDFILANAAVFICERSLLEHPDFKDAQTFSRDIFELAINGNKVPIYGFDIGTGFRYDLGSAARLFDANMKLLRGELMEPLIGKQQDVGLWVGVRTILDGAHITPPVHLGAGISIGRDACIGPDVVIGDGCQIGAGAVLRRAVLFENCRIGTGARLDTCILGSAVRIDQEVVLPSYTALGDYSVGGGEYWPNWMEVLG